MHNVHRPIALAREEVAPWLMSLGDLFLILLCMFVLLAAVEQRRHTERQQPTDTKKEQQRTRRQPRQGSDEPGVWRLGASAGIGREIDGGGPIASELDVASRSQGASVGQDAAPSRSEVEAALRDIFRPAGDLVEIEADPGAVTVRLRDTITFPSGTADLLPGVRPLLDQVAELLVGFPDVRIETSGHTDDVPIATNVFPSNWELSAARAAAVARYLLSYASIDPRRVKIAGYAEYRPLDSEFTVDGRARNRRVEIRFMGTVTGSVDSPFY